MPSGSSELADRLRVSATQLRALTVAVEAGETTLRSHIEALQESENKVRSATRSLKGPPTSEEAAAYRDWTEAASGLRGAVHRSLETLDGSLSDLRLARTALRAYSSLNPHTTSQHIHKKL